MNAIRSYIRQVLAEDLRGFLNKTWDISYNVGGQNASTLDRPENVDIKDKARAVKSAWWEEADQTFFASLTKVHWLSDSGTYNLRRTNEVLNNVLSLATQGSELPTTGYTPGTVQNFAWGQWGIIVGGEKCVATFAANSMEDVVSGYVTRDALALSFLKRGRNPLPRRPLKFDPQQGAGAMSKDEAIELLLQNPTYLLDADSWREPTRGRTNEIIVKHWKILGIIVANEAQITGLIDAAKGVTKGIYNPATRSYMRVSSRDIPDWKNDAMNLIQTILDSGFRVYAAPDTENPVDFRGMVRAELGDEAAEVQDVDVATRFAPEEPPKMVAPPVPEPRPTRSTPPTPAPPEQPAPSLKPAAGFSWLFDPVK